MSRREILRFSAPLHLRGELVKNRPVPETYGRLANEVERHWTGNLNYQVDPRHGEWYEKVSAEGVPPAGQAKGTLWKAAYHNGRALMNVSEMLRRLK